MKKYVIALFVALFMVGCASTQETTRAPTAQEIVQKNRMTELEYIWNDVYKSLLQDWAKERVTGPIETRIVRAYLLGGHDEIAVLHVALKSKEAIFDIYVTFVYEREWKFSTVIVGPNVVPVKQDPEQENTDEQV